MSAVVQLEANLIWRAQHSTTSSRWLGFCDPLNITLEADSLDELHSLIPETIELLFRDLLEDNELDEYLRHRGWSAKNLTQAKQAADVTFDVPWQLVAAGGSGDIERSPH